MKNVVGLKHLASDLGLSIAAISRALKDYDDISEETKRKVRLKAIELGYIPKSLKESHKKIIAILVNSLGSSFFGIIAEKLIEELKKYNCLVHFISTAQNFASKENIKEALELSADGIISFIIPDDDAYEIALLYRIPVLLFGRYIEKPKLNVVYMDDFLGGQIAASYLIEKGAKKLCYIGVNEIECSLRRQEGFINGCYKNNIRDIQIIQNSEIYKVADFINDGYLWYFCFDDGLANYLINSQKGKNIHVIGFNGLSKFFEEYNFFASISANYDDMISDTASILNEKIINQNNGEAIIVKHKTELCE